MFVYACMPLRIDTGSLEKATYINFKEKVNKIKDDLVLFLIEQKRSGNKVVALSLIHI